jgi:hypothetical protein
MNKRILLATFFIIFISTTQAQIKDIGAIVNNSILIDQSILYNTDNSIFGYIYLYAVDEVEKNNWKCEYLILDKNLNEIARNSFVQRLRASRTVAKVTDCRKIVDNVLVQIGYINDITIDYGRDNWNYVLFTYRDISLKENTISEEYFSRDGHFENIKVNDDSLHNIYWRTHSVFEIYPVDNLHYSGYLLNEKEIAKGSNSNIHKLRSFDINRNLLWTFEFNQSATDISYSIITDIYCPDDIALITFKNYYKKKFVGHNLVGVDLLSGKKLFDYELENADSAYYHAFICKKYNDRIYLTGVYSPNNDDRFSWKKRMGWFMIELGIDGKQIMKKYHPWTDASKFLMIDENGVLEDGYRLDSKDIFIFEDGTIWYLAEKLNLRISASKSSDMVLVNFDSTFNIKSVKVIKKDVSTAYHYDYLFSQYIKNNTGAVFFFQDYRESDLNEGNNKWYFGISKWYLGINKIINGNYSYEEILISSGDNDYVIYPYIAKEGYIMLREHNEKDKFNQIRLERLNY